jgi:hypothetical protein
MSPEAISNTSSKLNALAQLPYLPRAFADEVWPCFNVELRSDGGRAMAQRTCDYDTFLSPLHLALRQSGQAEAVVRGA